MNLNRKHLNKKFAQIAKISEKDAHPITSHFLLALRLFFEDMEVDDNLILRGVGTFYCRLYKGRTTVRNPKTGEPAIMAARRRLRFRASKLIKEKYKKV